MLSASPGGKILTVRDFLLGGGKTTPGRGREGGMTSNQTRRAGPCLRDGAPFDVTTWRRCRLLEAGFPEDLAARLAATSRVDLHALLQLVDRGCPPELAARILSPLSPGVGPA